MRIKDLQKQAHALAKQKGFWEILPDTKKVAPRNLSELLMLIVTELGEACEALRKNLRQDVISQAANCRTKGEWLKDTFEDELADAVIRICDLAESEGINLEWQIKKKMEYNKTRPIKHGKQF